MKNLRYLATLFVLAASATFTSAQTPASIRVPAQFSTAKTAFLGSAGSSVASGRGKQITSMLYVSMYQALASAKIFELTSAPADAELSMTFGAESAASDTTNGTSFGYTFVRLAVFDTKTHSLLWNIDEPIKGAFREKSFIKNVDDATSRIIADLKALAAGNLPSDSPDAAAKTRPSEEKP